jgi:electron-transferring-flavoprotein dehydrogenase
MKTGMLAADTAYEAIRKGDLTRAGLAPFEEKVRRSFVHDELFEVRNFHQPYQKGLLNGLINTGLQLVTGGRGLSDPYPSKAGYQRMASVKDYYGRADAPATKIKFDGALTFDKLSDVYLSGTTHDEDQPAT